jgi:hypothetical protein
MDDAKGDHKGALGLTRAGCSTISMPLAVAEQPLPPLTVTLYLVSASVCTERLTVGCCERGLKVQNIQQIAVL